MRARTGCWCLRACSHGRTIIIRNISVVSFTQCQVTGGSPVSRRSQMYKTSPQSTDQVIRHPQFIKRDRVVTWLLASPRARPGKCCGREQSRLVRSAVLHVAPILDAHLLVSQTVFGFGNQHVSGLGVRIVRPLRPLIAPRMNTTHCWPGP